MSKAPSDVMAISLTSGAGSPNILDNASGVMSSLVFLLLGVNTRAHLLERLERIDAFAVVAGEELRVRPERQRSAACGAFIVYCVHRSSPYLASVLYLYSLL